MRFFHGVRVPSLATLTKHGITESEWRDIAIAQGFKCGIHGGLPKSGILHIDHDHKTGRLRGLLCWLCNKFLLIQGVTPTKLRSAADYIERRDWVSDLLGREVRDDSSKSRASSTRKRKTL
jgi:hypothetical protein